MFRLASCVMFRRKGFDVTSVQVIESSNMDFVRRKLEGGRIGRSIGGIENWSFALAVGLTMDKLVKGQKVSRGNGDFTSIWMSSTSGIAKSSAAPISRSMSISISCAIL